MGSLFMLPLPVQAADDAWDRELLRGALADRPEDVYHALLTVILRLVFLLYAEERDLLPEGETFARHYSLAGLYERLREDAALHPDTMNQRYGAWAQLLVLFRLFHDGAEADGLQLPRRLGVLFDPDRFPFLEGRRAGGTRQGHERVEPPLVPDGTVYRALDKLLVLDGERISYLGFEGRLPREPGFIPPGSGVLAHHTPGFSFERPDVADAETRPPDRRPPGVDPSTWRGHSGKTGGRSCSPCGAGRRCPRRRCRNAPVTSDRGRGARLPLVVPGLRGREACNTPNTATIR